MKIKIGTDKSSLYLDILLAYLVRAIKHMDLGEGTLLYPIPLDKFVVNNADDIPEITIGIDKHIEMTLESSKNEEKHYSPKLHYCKGSDLTKASEQSINWSNIFHISDMGSGPDAKITISPDGFLYVKSDDTNKNCTIDLRSEAPPLERYIGYSAVLSLNMETTKDGHKKRLYFILDPLMKVSSNQG
ncbi:hypothetical protein SB49_14190 [Sediminicola sp. YIK13]|uniref:hypothetical protein n=1 Tax=Sediminicola sp. YIK13 TaxID=1453352 RepID=UPI00071FC919|nr:hypothetical protein [Sediminicola sp. YIK13]ALM08816.1 hypothetical protein SB49_14190 [Sediminicola sp. YIK13]